MFEFPLEPIMLHTTEDHAPVGQHPHTVLAACRV